jgi:prepilin-type N-terminal cleavage/methylation domain-containing protein
MKFYRTALNDHPVGRAYPRAERGAPELCKGGSSVASPHQSGFTMVEIAISLAIIGIALVAIIGVLPLGMNVQKDNREETIINQDATVLLEDIRNGARGADDLTNYVYAITNFWTSYDPFPGGLKNSGANGYTYTNSLITSSPGSLFRITNGAHIIGLLSIPKYTADRAMTEPINNLFYGGYSNHIVAYVRSISGPAVEKPPQDNPLVTGDSFSYKIISDNLPVEVDTNAFNSPNLVDRLYATNLTDNLHELRLTFLWPLLPSGNTGAGRQTFRTMIAGQIVQTNDSGRALYFFQPQSFTNVP